MNITFKAMKWVDWVKAVEKAVHTDYMNNQVTMEEILSAPPLDPDNLNQFCENFQAPESEFPSYIFVKHPKEANSYWFVTAMSADLIYHPQRGHGN